MAVTKYRIREFRQPWLDSGSAPWIVVRLKNKKCFYSLPFRIYPVADSFNPAASDIESTIYSKGCTVHKLCKDTEFRT